MTKHSLAITNHMGDQDDTSKSKYFVSKKYNNFLFFIIVALVLGSVGWAAAMDKAASSKASSQMNETVVEVEGAKQLQAKKPTNRLQADIHTNNTGDAQRAEVTVNGQDVPVPDNGTVKKSIKGQNSDNTSVNVSIKSTSKGSSDVHSSTHIDVNSTSDTEVIINKSE